LLRPVIELWRELEAVVTAANVTLHAVPIDVDKLLAEACKIRKLEFTRVEKAEKVG